MGGRVRMRGVRREGNAHAQSPPLRAGVGGVWDCIGGFVWVSKGFGDCKEGRAAGGSGVRRGRGLRFSFIGCVAPYGVTEGRRALGGRCVQPSVRP